jgi:uncharacterized protein YbbC (DUF1343 family)
MRNLAVFLSILFFLLTSTTSQAKPIIQLGIDVLEAQQFKQLAGQRVGLICNPASVNSKRVPTAVVLKNAPGVNLVALFGPEHGVWGDEYAGDKIPDKVDDVLNLPVFSLYGSTRKPTKEMLDRVDVMVFDLQDIGARSYTYISTMKVVLEACAEQNKPLIILDRPNPLGGNRIEGGPVEKGFESFVSFLDIPYVHGMTMGELARMVRDQVAPSYNGLTVIEMKGWTRDMVWQDTGLDWIPTSPHIPHVSSIAAYVATGQIGELGGVMSNGVGYTLPFEVVGSPVTKGQSLADEMNKVWGADSGVYFRPVRFKPFYATYKGEVCQGVQVHIDPKTAPNLTEINYRMLQRLDAPTLIEKSLAKPNLFDKSTGSDEMKEALAESKDIEPIFARWRSYSEQFRKDRSQWLLYQ